MGGDFDAIVGRVLAGVPRQSRAVVAIDGVGGSGKSIFAERLARRGDGRPVIVLHVDDFFNPSAIRRARGRHSPEGFWLDAFNYEALISWALTPLAAAGGGLYRPASYDHANDQIVEADPLRAPPMRWCWSRGSSSTVTSSGGSGTSRCSSMCPFWRPPGAWRSATVSMPIPRAG